VKIVWGILQSAIAIVLLVSGGLQGLQTASILAALPFAIIMVFMCFAIYIALNQEAREMRKRDRERRKQIEKLLMKENETV
jgi:glycine betaine transporter